MDQYKSQRAVDSRQWILSCVTSRGDFGREWRMGTCFWSKRYQLTLGNDKYGCYTVIHVTWSWHLFRSSNIISNEKSSPLRGHVINNRRFLWPMAGMIYNACMDVKQTPWYINDPVVQIKNFPKQLRVLQDSSNKIFFHIRWLKAVPC